MIYKNVNGTQKLVTNIRKPKQWRRFEYLESTSAGTYIDIDYNISSSNFNKIKLYMDFTATLNNVGNRWWSNGLGGSGSGLVLYVGIGGGVSGTNVPFTYGNGTLDIKTNINGDLGTRYRYTLDMSNKTYIVKNTSDSTLVNLSNFTINTPNKTLSPTIFAWKRGNNGVIGSTFSAKVYSYKLWDDNQLIRDYVPAQYNGQYGMWDLVENKFYGNKGTGTFTVGPEIPNYDEIEKLIVPTIDRDTLLQYHLPDTITYTEPDGSKWLRIFHHSNPASKLFASNDTFATYVYKDEDRWFNVALCNKLSSWEFLVKQKLLSTDNTVYQYRWSQNKNPMTATFDEVARANVTYNTNGYNTTTYGGLYKKNGSTYLSANNGISSNWWGAIGAWANYLSGIPAWNGLVVKSGYMDLYVRIDNQPFKEIPIWVLKNALIGDGNAYINTGVKLDPTKKIRIVTEVTAHPDDGNPVAFFGTNDYLTGIMGIYHYTNNNEYYLYVHGQSHTGNRTFNINAGELIQFDSTIDFPNLSTTGTFQGTQINGTFTLITDTTYPITVFKSQYATKYKGKCYKFQIYLDDVLIRNYVPATMGGRPGLYDKVNHKMYFNANSSGNFTIE